MNLIIEKEIKLVMEKDIIQKHKSKAFIKNKYPYSLSKAKKFGVKGPAIFLTVRVAVGNPDPRLPKRGRKAYYATQTRKVNKLDIAINRAKKKYPKYAFYKGYELAKNSKINVSEIFIFN